MKTILKFLTVVIGLIFMAANTTFAGTNQSPGTVKDICFAKDAVQLVWTSGNTTADLTTAGDISPQYFVTVTVAAEMQGWKDKAKTRWLCVNSPQNPAIDVMTMNQTAETPALVQWRLNSNATVNNSWNLTAKDPAALVVKWRKNNATFSSLMNSSMILTAKMQGTKAQWRNSDVATWNLTDQTRTMVVQWRSSSFSLVNNMTGFKMTSSDGTTSGQPQQTVSGNTTFSMNFAQSATMNDAQMQSFSSNQTVNQIQAS